MDLFEKFFLSIFFLLLGCIAGAWTHGALRVSAEPYWRLGSINIYRAVDSQTDVACYVLMGNGERAQIACATYRMRAGAVGDPNDETGGDGE